MSEVTTKTKTQKAKDVIFHWADMTIDLLAAILFLVGSGMFLDPSLKEAAVWLFIAGSFLFGVKPAVKIVRTLITDYPRNQQ